MVFSLIMYFQADRSEDLLTSMILNLVIPIKDSKGVFNYNGKVNIKDQSWENLILTMKIWVKFLQNRTNLNKKIKLKNLLSMQRKDHWLYRSTRMINLWNYKVRSQNKDRKKSIKNIYLNKNKNNTIYSGKNQILT